MPFTPIATPTSACFSAGASFTPSPVIATTAPVDCSARTIRSLCSDVVRAKTVGLVRQCGQVGVVHAFEIGAGHHMDPRAHPKLGCDGGGGQAVVAGDHLDLDPGGVAFGDGGARLGPGGSISATMPRRDQAAFGHVRNLDIARAGFAAHRKAQTARAARCQVCDAVGPPVAVYRVIRAAHHFLRA